MTDLLARPLFSKLPEVGTTIFTVMSHMANTHQAINLGQGFPDFNTDAALLELVTQAMAEGHNQYPAMAGVPALRQAIAEKVAALYGRRYDPEQEITVTSGATEGLLSTLLAFVHPGDEVIVIEPCYDAYRPAIRLAGGTPVAIPMLPPNADHESFRVDWQRVRDAVTPRTRLLMLNFPNNPTGINLQNSDLDFLETLVADTGILLLSDEAYEHIVFDGGTHQSLARRPALAENAIVVSSFGKTYHTTGWKIGYCCAPARLTSEIRRIHQFVVFTVPSPLQVALAKYMADPKPYLELPAFYQRKRDLLMQGLQRTRFRPIHSEGTFFLLADYSEISDLPESEFAIWLTQEHGVAVIPVAAFYDQPHSAHANHRLARFCFAKQDATLETALERLAAL